jgi:hypothetical protein
MLRARRRFTRASVALVFLGGLGIGAAIAYLTVPHSGRAARDRLRELAREGKERLTASAGQAGASMRDALGSATRIE